MVEIAKGINRLLRLFNSVKLTAHLGFLNIAGCRPNTETCRNIEETTGWGIKISNFSKGYCEGCSGGREVGVVTCSWLASTVVSTHNGLDR